MAQIQGDASTPLMKQYWDLKSQANDALLLFRMGDFYELFGDDAIEAARILEITLTSRDRNRPNPTPMAGVPHHSIQGYIQRLLKAGKKVAIGEQMEDPATVSGKNIVRREITRVFTPGVQFDCEGSEANYLAILLPASSQSKDDNWIMACLDASTGEALVSDPLKSATLPTELQARPVRHFIKLGNQNLPEAVEVTLQALSAGQNVLLEELPSNYLMPPQAQETLKKHYGLDQLGAFLTTEASILALGVLVTYACRTQKIERLAHLRIPAPLHQPKTMQLGPRTSQHLDLIPTAEGTPNLYQLINRTRSALGARQLKRWILSPLRTAPEISARQESVREIAQGDPLSNERLSGLLAEVYDLERISGRVNTQLANPRDTLQLGRTLAALTPLRATLESYNTPTLASLRQIITDCARELEALGKRITENQKEDAPISIREGGIFNRGTSPELDHLIDLTENGQRFLVELETRERELTGIPSLKVRYNRVFGYYIEITQAHLKNVPSHYQRKQTTVGAERFFTEELKKFEDEIVTAEARKRSLEQQLFADLLKSVQEQTSWIMEGARALGELDALLALSRLADEPGWCFPQIDESMDLEIVAGRHPLVDAMSGGSFVPNDLKLSDKTRLTLMITGPNMGGKSTVMRQCALIVILGQMGAPVPASSARWGTISSLYTRIGAHDAIARGQSTFMVEMSELAHILHYADARSLIILDEIGRGTSTYDGMSVAWATLEWICEKIQARTLFATHYHELTRLSASLPLLANAHMAVESEGFTTGKAGERKGSRSANLRFLYLLREGPTNESFGIHVAQIAGLPKQVVSRAWKVLEELEDSTPAHGRGAGSTSQLSLFDAPKAPMELEEAEEPAEEIAPTLVHVIPEEVETVLSELKGLRIEEMTPLQALNALAELQKKSGR